jgi:lipopolysaccharide transport system ATP-binding protein
LTTQIDVLTDEPERYHITYHLHNELGEPMFSFSSSNKVQLQKGTNKLTCAFPSNFFQSGNYSLSLYVVVDKRTAIFIENDVFIFTVVDRARELGVYMGREPGYIRPQFNWKNELS